MPHWEAMGDHVLMLHGLWMRGVTLMLLRRRLQRAGFVAENFEYPSVSVPFARSVELLRARMRALPAPVHLVGHSLGGLLALDACRDAANLPSGRIVCLGSPLAGSAAARGMAGSAPGRWWLGWNRNELATGTAAWNGSREVGVIAGTLGLGFGRLFADFNGEHDGTVAVAETRLPGIADHCVIAASHAGLPFSVAAAEQALAFLRSGQFSEP